MSLVSVIIPVYNSARWLRQTLESVLGQDFLKEIICVDDHSTDESLVILQEFLKKYPDKIQVFTNPQKGSNSARNFGFVQSTGKYIQWLDADDQLLPGKFKAQVTYLEQHNECDIAYSDWYMDFYDEQCSRIERKARKRTAYPDYLYELLRDNWSPPANYLLRREVAQRLHSLGQWNPATRVAQDREYFTMAALEGSRFCYVPGFFSVYNRWSSGQISAMDFRQRLMLQMDMERRFHGIILQKNYPRGRRRRYLACLNAHVINANYYYPSIGFPFVFSIFNVNWRIVHWKKWFVAPFLYLYGVVKFFLSRRK